MKQEHTRHYHSHRLSTFIIITSIIIAALLAGGWCIKAHNDQMTKERAAKTLQQRQNAYASRQAAILKSEQEFRAAYAGRLQSWNTILGSRNPIPNWPVRPRSEIMTDISAKESQIEQVRTQQRAITTQHNTTTVFSNGQRVHQSHQSYNTQQMQQLSLQLAQLQSNMNLLLAELYRDDYFEGRVSGYDLGR